MGVLVGLSLLLPGCVEGPSFGPPESLDLGTWERVDRRVENELMAEAASVLRSMGLQDTFGAAYEFLPHKPQIFLGAGHGTADRQALMDRVLPLFGGEYGPIEPPRVLPKGAVAFLCAPYSHTGVPGTVGTGGLASIAAVCTWSDGDASGFGVGVAGLSVEDVLRLTSESHRLVASG